MIDRQVKYVTRTTGGKSQITLIDCEFDYDYDCDYDSYFLRDEGDLVRWKGIPRKDTHPFLTCPPRRS